MGFLQGLLWYFLTLKDLFLFLPGCPSKSQSPSDIMLAVSPLVNDCTKGQKIFNNFEFFIIDLKKVVITFVFLIFTCNPSLGLCPLTFISSHFKSSLVTFKPSFCSGKIVPVEARKEPCGMEQQTGEQPPFRRTECLLSWECDLGWYVEWDCYQTRLVHFFPSKYLCC